MLSVIICTYDPDPRTLSQVIDALKSQTLATTYWELLIIDNNSAVPVWTTIDLKWHPKYKVIQEPVPGLVNARMTGAAHATGGLLVFVDDDNVLDRDHLRVALDFHRQAPAVGSFGGKALPVYEVTPPTWFKDLGISLGCGDHGEELIISEYRNATRIQAYPDFAPIGTGMAITAIAFDAYASNIRLEQFALGRNGRSLASGEDNDIILTLIKAGFEIAYLPALVVHHLISEQRLTFGYLTKMSFDSNKTWVKVLDMHQLNPWQRIPKWSLIPRKALSFFRSKAYLSIVNYIKWRGMCGRYEALAELP